MPDCASVERTVVLGIPPSIPRTLQMNITHLCNQACAHCHVDAAPSRREMMPAEVVDACVEAVRLNREIEVVDITGGAPELHPGFRSLVARMRELGRRVIVRHNLTVTLEAHPVTGESMRYLPDFFAEHAVHLLCSLPCYLPENTDLQRGEGVHALSIAGLKMLNERGYGAQGSGLILDLVHNPGGTALPADQRSLEADYRSALCERYDAWFNSLLVMANVPVNRFARSLEECGAHSAYLDMLDSLRNPSVEESLMCRHQVSVGLDGTLYDCDFNQALGLAVGEHNPVSIDCFDARSFTRREVRTGEHCLACMAGVGSSCGGALHAG